MANLKQEIIKQFEGFGNDSKITRGEYYRSSGFLRSPNGIIAGGYVSSQMTGNAVTDLGAMTVNSLAYARSFGSASQSPSNYLFASGNSGEIIQSDTGVGTGEYAHRSFSAHAYFNNLITDPKGRLLYHQDQYLGMFDGTGSTTNYITGTVAVTNGSANVVGTGTTFTAGMVGKAFKVAGTTKFYLVATYTDATHITINSTYSGSTNATASYIINTQYNDTWKNFGAVVTLPNGSTPKCPMDIYEDTVIFGRGNVITTLNVLTDTITTDALPALSFPAGYSIDHIVSGSNGILIGGNVRSKGFILLWDNLSDRAIAPWIWFDDSVLSVCRDGSNWIVTTSRGVYRTNGYSTEIITTNILETSTNAMIANSPKNSLVIDNALHFYGSGSNRGIKRNVFYRMNLTSKLVEAFPLSTLNQIAPTCTQVEYVAEASRIFLGINGLGTANGVFSLITRSAPTCSTYITVPVGQGANNKVAKQVKIRIRRKTPLVSNLSDTFAFKLAVKIADCKHTMYGFAQTKVASAVANQITINGTIPSFQRPKVGHEVEILGDSGVDTNAGYARNLVSISGQGTATEVWTMDSNYPSLMAINQNLTITPFQLVGRKSVSVTDGEVQEYVFSVKNSITSNKFMIKVEIEDNTSGIQLELEEPIFLYEDKGSI